MTDSLIIKDGIGNLKYLEVESGSCGYMPVHVISSSDGDRSVFVTSSFTNPVIVTGTVAINNISLNVTAASPAVTTVGQSSVTSFSWSTAASGTFQIAANNTARKGLTVFNPGPNNLYVALSSTGGATNGFTLTNTASAPSYYSFIVYPSGTYQADTTNVGVNYGGYFISGSASAGVFITSIS